MWGWLAVPLVYHWLTCDNEEKRAPKPRRYKQVTIASGKHVRIEYAHTGGNVSVAFEVAASAPINVFWVSKNNYKAYLDSQEYTYYCGVENALKHSDSGVFHAATWNFVMENKGKEPVHVSYYTELRG